MHLLLFLSVLLFLLSVLWMGGYGQQQLTYYNSPRKTWYDAQAFCREFHTDLVTIKNDTQNLQINEDSWIGIYQDPGPGVIEWKWSIEDEIATYIPWANVPGKGENCGFKDASAGLLWQPKQCTEKHEFFCVDEPLILVNETKTWEEALVHCRTMKTLNTSISYSLATLTKTDNYVKGRMLLQKTAEDQAWIGLRLLGDQWMWVDGEKVQYSHSQYCTYGRCGTLDKNNTRLFTYTQCQKKNYFFCYMVQPSV